MNGIEGLWVTSDSPLYADGRVVLANSGSVLRLDSLDDVLLVRADRGDFLVPFASFGAEGARGYALNSPRDESAIERTRRRWIPALSSAEAFFVACGSELLRIDRRRLTALGEPTPEDSPYEIEGLVEKVQLPGPILTIGPSLHHDDTVWVVCAAGQTLSAHQIQPRGAEITRATLNIPPALHWVGFTWSDQANGGGFMLGLSSPDQRASAQIHAAAVLTWSPDARIVSRQIQSELENARVLVERPAAMIGSRLFAEISFGHSPVVAAISKSYENAPVTITLVKDELGHQVRGGAQLGAVSSGMHRAVAVASTTAVGFVESDSLRPGTGWRLPETWHATMPRFAVQRSMVAGVVKTSPGRHQCIVTDVIQGVGTCNVRHVDLPDDIRAVEMVCLQHDILWLVFLDHSDLIVRWLNLPALFDPSANQELGE